MKIERIPRPDETIVPGKFIAPGMVIATDEESRVPTNIWLVTAVPTSGVIEGVYIGEDPTRNRMVQSIGGTAANYLLFPHARIALHKL